jgi:MFS family permease
MPDPSLTRPVAPPRAGVLAPLLHPGVFRIIWLANLVSAIGTMMQMVGASWLMTTLTGSPAMVALVQTATLAPILLFALMAGTIADLFDRRQVLIVAQLWIAGVSALLAALGILGLLGAGGILLLTFALGMGTALNGPAWQAAVREIVPRTELAAAVTLNAIAFNMARAIGPAVGGVLIAAFGPEAAFLTNAVSSLALIVALLVWGRERPKDDLPRERLGHALITGLRYVQETAAIRAVLARGAVFGVAAAAVMALLPLLARNRLGGDATLYGLSLGAFGVGALAGAFIIHPIRQARGAEFVITLLSGAFGVALLLIGLLPSLPVVALALPIAGAAWLGAFSTFNISVQMVTAPWVQARVLALYQTVIFGGMAAGSWLWGHVADLVGIDATHTIAGACFIASLLLHFLLPMPRAEPIDIGPMPSRREEPKPALLFDFEEGPVLVMIEYQVPEARTAEFRQAMEDVGHMRKRDGAWRWNLFEDTADCQRWLETFTLSSWFDYLRQRRRGTASDEAIILRARALLMPGTQPIVRRMIVRTPDRALAVEPPSVQAE